MRIFKIAIFLLILIMSVGAVCAANATSDDMLSDDNQDSLKTTQEDMSSIEESQYTFTDLKNCIDNATDFLEITENYKFNNETDHENGIFIEKDNFTINGNNHILDGNRQSGIFIIWASNITINNLVFANGNLLQAGALYSLGQVTLNNVTFINNTAAGYGGAVFSHGQLTVNNATFINNKANEHGGAIVSQGQLTLSNATFIGNNATKDGGAIYNDNGAVLNCYGCKFIDNDADFGHSIRASAGTVTVYDSVFTSKIPNRFGQIALVKSEYYLDNLTFENITSSYSPAIYATSASGSIVNSRFKNLAAAISAGAISIKEGSNTYIQNCQFINTCSSKNAGAIHVDIAGVSGSSAGNVTIMDTLFKDTVSEFGGAYIQLGGNLSINNSEFINNKATYAGGSIYISYANAEIDNCMFDSNSLELIEGYPTCGGALYCDMGNLTLSNSTFINNSASSGNAIYAYDASYNITGSIFINNTNAICTFYDKGSNLDDNEYNNDTVSTNNTNSYGLMDGQGIELALINNAINVTNLPSRFDLRDWGWVSPVRNQGRMGACWAFGMTGALESALLKATGMSFDLSENNMQNTLLKYSPYGITTISEGGDYFQSMFYFISWLGAFSQEADVYDEIGKTSPVITTLNDVHVQDVVFVRHDEPGSSLIKEAIIKYGSLEVCYFGQSTFNQQNPYYNPQTFGQYTDVPISPNHAVSVVGWDDNYSKDNFLVTPPGDGAWIIKNSWGPSWGDDGYLYVSYYDKTLSPGNDTLPSYGYVAGFVFENTVPYNKNYEYDISGDLNFSSSSNMYCNIFVSAGDDLIAGVGTFFNDTNVEYAVEVYVNDELKCVQNGVSDFIGFHTIKLDSYVPVKKDDVFKVVIKSNVAAYLINSRRHIIEGVSFIYDGDDWYDLSLNKSVACLKVYTVADDTKIVNNKDIIVDYDGGKYFSVTVVTDDGHAVGAGEKVSFKINGKTTTINTNADGIAKIKITDVPKKYTITTTYKGKSVKNTVTVKQVLTASKVTVKKTAKKFTLKATLKINGKLQKGKWITFKFNGKTYKVKTNAKGVAQKTLNKNVIKKLKKGKTYTVKVTYIKDTIKTTVKVK
ncbi:C1 family peptidase [uncultured Methanobrevibacter sp.]|uniref:C1 family peptidase n=1 Tax=uncultured Methanobrevibacter sp. TaxID=253161 RepID=UPI00261B57F4|nr:C1 family peptidase [uncultured Methanobrevibacter sp.]